MIENHDLRDRDSEISAFLGLFMEALMKPDLEDVVVVDVYPCAKGVQAALSAVGNLRGTTTKGAARHLAASTIWIHKDLLYPTFTGV